MEKVETKLKGVYELHPKVFGDHRGWFMETFSVKVFEEMGLKTAFVQDNHSYSGQKGTLRGLHFQKAPKAQTKLVRCIKGAILDVVVDLRKDSPTYLQWMGVELSQENKKMLFIPKGFAHGFLTLTQDVEIQYKVDAFYAPEADQSIRYDDPTFKVDWGTDQVILSTKDEEAPFFLEAEHSFVSSGGIL